MKNGWPDGYFARELIERDEIAHPINTELEAARLERMWDWSDGPADLRRAAHQERKAREDTAPKLHQVLEVLPVRKKAA